MHKIPRKRALELMKVALLMGENGKAMQVYIENNISFKVYREYCRLYQTVGR